MRVLKITLAALLGLTPLRLPAADGSAATTFSSMKFERGARAAAMGGAYVAATDGVDALFWNPAGLAGLRRLELFASHTNWIAGISDQQVGFGMPWYGVGAWGVGLSYVSTQLQGRDDFGQPTAEFSAFDFTARSALTLEVTRWLSAGASYRLLRQGYGDRFSMGSAFDAGLQFRKLLDRKLTIGIASVNMGTDISLGNSPAPLPWEIKGGAALKLARGRVLLSADVGYEPHTFFTKTRLGAELADRFGGLDVALRGGYQLGTLQQAGGLAGLTAGGGIGLAGFAIDYAWQPVGDFGDSHKFSLTYTFD